MKLRSILIASALTGATLSALAHPEPGWNDTRLPRVDHRQSRQVERIDHGRATGALTPAEAHRLMREQRFIAHTERMARADGVVTPRERAHLNAMLDRAGRHIERELHDHQFVRRHDIRRIHPHG